MPDNFESRMKFIIEQRAKFRADMQLLKERQAETQEMTRQMANVWNADREKIRQLVDVTMPLTPQGRETDRRRRELGARIDELLRQRADAGARTDLRLAALIDTVDRLVRRNGS